MKVLPESWKEVSLADVLDKIVDGSHNPPAGAADGHPMLSARNILDNTLDLKDFRRLSEADFSRENARTHATTGDVLLTIVGTIGRSYVIREADGPLTFQRSVAVLHPVEISAKFCSYQFQSPHFQHQLETTARGTAQKGVYLGLLSTLRIHVAPIAEQDRIVAEIEKQFTRLDAATAALKRVQANLKRYRASVLKAACEGRLVPTEAELARNEGRDYEPADKLLERILRERRARWESDTLAKMIAAGKPPRDDGWKQKYKEPSAPDTTNLPALPEGWSWASAEQVCGFITKGTTPSSEKMFDSTGEIPFIKVYNLTHSGKLDFSVNPTFINRSTHLKELFRSRVFPGDVLMNIVGPPLGKVSVVPDLYDEWNVNQAVAIFRPLDGLDRGFLAALLMSDDLLHWAMRKAKATAGQFNLTLEICRDLPIPLPPWSEQQRIVAEVDRQVTNFERTRLLVTSATNRHSQLRQASLHAAFSGQLVAQDPADEPASALLERIHAKRASQAERTAAQNANQRHAPRKRRD